MDFLSLYSISLESLVLNKIPDEDILEILNDSLENEEMIRVLSRIVVDTTQDVSIEDRIKYYEDLINQICSNSKHKYPDEDKDLFIAFLLREYCRINEDVVKMCEDCINKYKNRINTMTDEYWYMYQSIQYSLLGSYKFDKMKENVNKFRKIVSDLKNTKEKYNKLMNYWNF